MDIDSSRRKYLIGILGGTGKEGLGLAFRWSKSGHEIIIGSRQLEKASAAAETISQMVPGGKIRGETNQTTAQAAEITVVTVPYSAHRELLSGLREELQGKILLDVTVPLVPPKVSRVQLPAAGSAALEAQQILGDQVQVISAFQNISYENLLRDTPIECDVLVSGGAKSARQIVLDLVKDAGMVGWDAGPLENSMVAEGLTSILIGINRQYGTQTAGIKITGVIRKDLP